MGWVVPAAVAVTAEKEVKATGASTRTLVRSSPVTVPTVAMAEPEVVVAAVAVVVVPVSASLAEVAAAAVVPEAEARVELEEKAAVQALACSSSTLFQH